MLSLRGTLQISAVFLDLAGNFAEIWALLLAATSVKESFKWTKEMKEAFNNLQNKLPAPPFLAFPYSDSLFRCEDGRIRDNAGGRAGTEEGGCKGAHDSVCVPYNDRASAPVLHQRKKSAHCCVGVEEVPGLPVLLAFVVYTDHRTL